MGKLRVNNPTISGNAAYDASWDREALVRSRQQATTTLAGLSDAAEQVFKSRVGAERGEQGIYLQNV